MSELDSYVWTDIEHNFMSANVVNTAGTGVVQKS